MAEQKGFLFFYDWEKPFSMLSGDQFKELFTAMIKYQRDGTQPPEFNGMSAVIASFVFPQLDRRAVCVSRGKMGSDKRYGKNRAYDDNDTSDSTTDSTANSTTDSTANSTANSTTNSTANSTTDSTTNSTTNSTASSQGIAQDKDKDIDIDIDKDIDIDQNKNIDIDIDKNIDINTNKDADTNKVRTSTPLSPQGDVSDQGGRKNNSGFHTLLSALSEDAFFPDQTFEKVSKCEHTSQSSRDKCSDDAVLEERFDTFWEAYPKKVAKEQARKAYFRLKPDEALSNIILDALKAHRLCSQWQNTQYIPNPATWINGKRWEDEAAVSNSDESENYIDLNSFFEN